MVYCICHFNIWNYNTLIFMENISNDFQTLRCITASKVLLKVLYIAKPLFPSWWGLFQSLRGTHEMFLSVIFFLISGHSFYLLSLINSFFFSFLLSLRFFFTLSNSSNLQINQKRVRENKECPQKMRNGEGKKQEWKKSLESCFWWLW